MIRFAALLLTAAAPATAQAERIEILSEALAAEDISTAPGLRVMGAWRLSAAHRGFGGFSGMTFVDGELLLLSDAGWLVRWTPEADEAEISPLPDACHHGAGSHAADAEAIALTPDGMEIRLALERGNRLCGFSPRAGAEARSYDLSQVLPPSGNNGIEAMATWPRRGTALIVESKRKGSHQLFWFDSHAGEEQTIAMRYFAPAGFKPGDAAFLPDGRLVVVNRRFGLRKGRSTALTLSPAFTPAIGGSVGGEVIARLENSPLAANYEGLAVQPTATGATLWLISDDNFANPRGTILLRMELDDNFQASALNSRGS